MVGVLEGMTNGERSISSLLTTVARKGQVKKSYFEERILKKKEVVHQGHWGRRRGGGVQVTNGQSPFTKS